MPTVEFHILSSAGDDARLRHACGLVEQAQQHSQSVFVRFNNEGDLRRFDELLWTFRDHAFIPHELMSPQAPSHPRIVAVLGHNEALPLGYTSLINIADDLPAQLDDTTQIYEVVDGDAQRKQQARERYKQYRDKGCALETINA